MPSAEEQVAEVQRIMKRSHEEYQRHYQVGLMTLRKADFLESILAELAVVVFPDDEEVNSDVRPLA